MIVAALVMLAVVAPPAEASDALWMLLKGGQQVVMIRHGMAPGVGDPPNFRLDDCSTQRNLDEQGRKEARTIGAAFRSREIPVGRVLSSQWCRCLETAKLAFGHAEPWPALNSYFNDRTREQRFTPEVRALAARRPEGGNLVLVTHNVNIQAVTGISPVSGEIVVVSPQSDGTFRIAGRMPPSALGTE